MSIADSLKAAGLSVVEVAKEFGTQVTNDRATRPAAEAPAGQSFMQQGQTVARDVFGTVRRAVEATAQSPAFDAAKRDVTSAFTEVRDEVDGRIAASRNKTSAPQDPASPYGPGTASGATTLPEDTIIDGEIVED